MRITEVTVHAGRTFNDPYESYANLKPSISLKAELGPDDDPDKIIRDLQAKAEGVIEDHKQLLLLQVADRHNLTRRQQEVASLQQTLQTAQRRLDELRESAAKGLPAPEAAPEEAEVEVVEQTTFRHRY